MTQGQQALSIGTTALGAGAVATSYSQTLSASGGTPPYTWALTSGTLPNGLSLSIGGVIAGTPSASGTFSFTVRVTDSTSNTATRSLSITVAPALSIVTTSLANGTVGAIYSQTLTATGGSGAYSWTLVSGTLPTGSVTLSIGGGISGTTTAAGTFSFTVRVNDGAGNTATRSFTITVSQPAGASCGTGCIRGDSSTGVRVFFCRNVAPLASTSYISLPPPLDGLDAKLFWSQSFSTADVLFRNRYNQTIYFSFEVYRSGISPPPRTTYRGDLNAGQQDTGSFGPILGVNVGNGGGACLVVDQVRFSTDTGAYYNP